MTFASVLRTICSYVFLADEMIDVCFSLQFPNCVKCNRKFDFTHRRVMKQLLKTDSKLNHYTITFANPLPAFQRLKFTFDYDTYMK